MLSDRAVLTGANLARGPKRPTLSDMASKVDVAFPARWRNLAVPVPEIDRCQAADPRAVRRSGADRGHRRRCDPAPRWIPALIAVAAVAILVIGWPWVGRRVRSWGYAERDDDLVVAVGSGSVGWSWCLMAGCSSSTSPLAPGPCFRAHIGAIAPPPPRRMPLSPVSPRGRGPTARPARGQGEQRSAGL